MPVFYSQLPFWVQRKVAYHLTLTFWKDFLTSYKGTRKTSTEIDGNPFRDCLRAFEIPNTCKNFQYNKKFASAYVGWMAHICKKPLSVPWLGKILPILNPFCWSA